jgi:hypothetical protein
LWWFGCKEGKTLFETQGDSAEITKIFLTKGHSATSARGFDRMKLALFTNCCCSLFYGKIFPD